MRVSVSLLALFLASQATAQGVRVRVADDQSNAPAAGALVSLKRAGRVVIERLADGDGLRLLAASADTGYSVEVRRVGFALFVSHAFAISPADTQPLELRVPSTRVPPLSSAAEPRRTRGGVTRAECRSGEAGRANAGELWEQIRTALVSSEIVRVEALEPLAIRRFERTIGRDGGVRDESQVSGSPLGTRLFRVVPPAELSRTGFAVPDSFGQIAFRAPDAAVLLSPEFAGDHCFGVVSGVGPTSGMLGLRFEPVPGRRVADIGGVLWADAETTQLRFAEFTYRLPPPAEAGGTGGRILFEQLASAHWIAREWVVRTPVLTQRGQLLGYREEGGDALGVSPRMLFVMDSIADSRKVPGVITGVVIDSLTGLGFPGATVWLDSAGRSSRTDAKGVYFLRAIPPGVHTVHFSHPMLDSIGIRPGGVPVNVVSEAMADAHLGGPSLRTLIGDTCGDTLAMMTGLVRDIGTGAPVDSADVTFGWINIVLGPSRRPRQIMPRAIMARTDASGRYAACVSATNEITATARRGMARSGSIDAVTGARRMGIVHFALDLSVEDSVRGAAALRGIVRYQDGSPLRNAVVTLTEPELSTTTDSAGAFRFASIPGGTRVIDTRAMGHAPVRTVTEVVPGDDTTRVVVFMRKVTMLDPIIVRAAADDRTAQTLADLEARQRSHVGFACRRGNCRRSRTRGSTRWCGPSRTCNCAPRPRFASRSWTGATGSASRLCGWTAAERTSA